MDPLEAYRRSIGGIESGHRYDRLGPVTKSGDRAYGYYQVMGSNVPQWTQRALGRQLTPDQFLRDQAAQDAVFRSVFGDYVTKYGPEGAARAWFAGERGMKNSSATDQLGTRVDDYGRRFMAGLAEAPAATFNERWPQTVAPAADPTPASPQYSAEDRAGLLATIGGLLGDSSRGRDIPQLPPLRPAPMPQRRYVPLPTIYGVSNEF